MFCPSVVCHGNPVIVMGGEQDGRHHCRSPIAVPGAVGQ